MKDLKIRLKSLKSVQERAGNTLEAIVISTDFLSRTPAAEQLKKGWTNGTSLNQKASA
jgi:hypothetical protein